MTGPQSYLLCIIWVFFMVSSRGTAPPDFSLFFASPTFGPFIARQDFEFSILLHIAAKAEQSWTSQHDKLAACHWCRQKLKDSLILCIILLSLHGGVSFVLEWNIFMTWLQIWTFSKAKKVGTIMNEKIMKHTIDGKRKHMEALYFSERFGVRRVLWSVQSTAWPWELVLSRGVWGEGTHWLSGQQ